MTAQEAFQYIVNSIQEIYGANESRSLARIVLQDAFDVIFSKPDDSIVLNNRDQELLNEIIKRLLTNEPVQYVVGKAHFYNLYFKVNKSVLIPRQETEELVAWILETIGQKSKHYFILDIGTGSGCIPVILKYKCPSQTVHALDVSEEALAVAKENAEKYNTEIEFKKADILDETEWDVFESYDIIVSNPPYISQNNKNILSKNVLEYEPHLALYADGNDALIFYKKIAAFALVKLKKEGHLFFEINEFYAENIIHILKEKGFHNIELREDLNGNKRMIKCNKKLRKE